MSKETVRQVVQRSLQELERHVIPWSPPAKEQLPGPPVPKKPKPANVPAAGQEPDLPDDAVQVLERIIRHLGEAILERCQALGFDRVREQRARKVLDRHGLVLVAAKIGKTRLHWATEKGLEWGRRRGIPIPRFKSHPGHEALLIRAMAALAEEWEVSFDRKGQFDGVQPDAVARFRDGARLALQVSVHNKADYEARAALKLAGLESIDKVLVLAASKGKRDQITKALRQAMEEGREFELGQHPGARVLDKVVVLDAGAALQPGFDWPSPLGNVGGPGRG